MPNHDGHVSWTGNQTILTSQAGYAYSNRPFYTHSGNELGVKSASAGSSQAHNNLQPYITTYMFKRTA